MGTDYQGKHDGLRSHFPPAQDTRNPVSISSRADLCGWDLSQLLLLHDDSGIVEWFNEEEHQIFPNGNKSGCCLYYSYVPLSDSRLKITHKHLPEIKAPFWQLQQTHEKRNNFSSLLNIDSGTKPSITNKTFGREDEEVKSLSNKPRIRAKEDECECHTCKCERICERRRQLLAKKQRKDLPQVFKIAKLEKKLASSRKSKIDKRVEGLRQPLGAKAATTLLKRERFTPSVISLMSADVVKGPSLLTYDKTSHTRTSHKKCLQLLPVDGAAKLSNRTDGIAHSKPITAKTILPTLETKRVFSTAAKQNPQSVKMQNIWPGMM